jgi:hypothetical protein
MRPVAEVEELGHRVQYLQMHCRCCYLESAVVTPQISSAVDRTCLERYGHPTLRIGRIVPFGWEKASLGILAAYPNGNRHYPDSSLVSVEAFAPRATQALPPQQKEEHLLSRCEEG